jgi:hypothetical protein
MAGIRARILYIHVYNRLLITGFIFSAVKTMANSLNKSFALQWFCKYSLYP